MKLRNYAPILILAFLASGCFAQAPSPSKNLPGKPIAAPPTGNSGVKVFIDPSTGKIKNPEQEEEQALSNASAKPAKPAVQLQVVTLPNGTLKVELSEEFMDATIVSIRPDGRLAVRCVTGTSKANEAVLKAAPGNAAKEKLDEK